MSNPFDDPEGVFHVLRNDEGQYSLWPVFVPVPEGWSVVLEAVARDQAVTHVEEHWTTLRPGSIAAGAALGR